MIRDCPKCGLANPPETRFCECGYDFLTKQVDRHRAPKHSPSQGWYSEVQNIRLAITGILIGLLGMGLLASELSGSHPSFWAIIRSTLIIVFGFGLLGVIIWLRSRSR